MAHAAYKETAKGERSCDTANTWGGATCTLLKNHPTKWVELKCPVTMLRVDTPFLSGYQLEQTGYSSAFSEEWHVFCYSRPIKIAK